MVKKSVLACLERVGLTELNLGVGVGEGRGGLTRANPGECTRVE
jgi:hypothetical protein